MTAREEELTRENFSARARTHTLQLRLGDMPYTLNRYTVMYGAELAAHSRGCYAIGG